MTESFREHWEYPIYVAMGSSKAESTRQMNKSTILMMAATSGLVATGSAATVYDETTGGDLSNDSMSPTVLTSGTDTVFGGLHADTDRDDHFIITNLMGGGTAQFGFATVIDDGGLQVQFTFRDPAGGVLYTSPLYTDDAMGSTGPITVPGSGQVKVSVQNFSTVEGGSPATTWSVSTNDVIPETSTAALAALGALLAMRRSRL